MIEDAVKEDDALYQQATEELNNGKRKMDLWVRACEIASNDHDEARFLYQSLRVAQLQTGDDTLILVPAPDVAPEETREPVDEAPIDLSLEDLEPTIRLSDTTEHGSNQESIDTRAPDHRLFEADTLTSTSDDEITARVDAPLEELDALDNGELPDTNETQTHRPRFEFESALHRQEDSSGITLRREIDADLDDEEPTVTPVVNPDQDVDVRLDDDRRREIDLALTDDPSEVALESLDQDRTDEFEWLDPHTSKQIDPVVATANTAAAPQRVHREAVPSTDTHRGGGTPFLVYKRNSNEYRAVKQGVSWTALLLTFPWLLKRGLLGTALMYALLWAVLVGGLLLMALAWADAGGTPAMPLQLLTAGFAVLAVIGMVYVPFRHANLWYMRKLEHHGYRLQRQIDAPNRAQAIGRVRAFQG